MKSFSNSKLLSRRFFIGGLASSLVCDVSGAFTVKAGTFTGDTARLTFGVLSDVHISLQKGGRGFKKNYGPETLVKALKWYRDNGVDAVVIAGDCANFGLVPELQAVADAWFGVFPDDHAPDGRKVERIFIFGNHEWSSLGRAMRIIPDKDECWRNLLAGNPRKWWQRIFHEDWSPFYEKVVKGYHFECAHWWSRGRSERYAKGGLKEFYDAHRGGLDPAVPFFHVQHPHPAMTVHGASVWGQDDGSAAKILASLPNAIAFSGHSHTSLTDERFIWQGGFTSVGCGSLRNVSASIPMDGLVYQDGMENGKVPVNGGSHESDFLKTMQIAEDLDCRQGLLVRVYSDRLVFTRREFMTDSSLGDDIVMPLPSAESRPFDFSRRRSSSGVPMFNSGSRLKVVRSKAMVRGGGKMKPKKTDAWVLSIPPANAARGVRVVAYEVEAIGKDGKRRKFAMSDCSARFSESDSRTSSIREFSVACERIGFPVSSFAVRGISCWGKCSDPIAVSVTGDGRS